MPSDAKVPDPAPRGITVPAGAVVVLVLTGAIWGVGLFLLGRQTAPPIEAIDRAGEAYLGALNRIDQTIAQGHLAEATAQLRSVNVPEGPLGKTALDLRQVHIAAVAADQATQAAEEAARREAASPAAVLRRLKANLWQSSDLMIAQPVPAVTVGAPPTSTPAPVVPSLPSEQLGDESFVPLARCDHPTIAGRSYALHPTRGLLRSNDGGKHWKPGLEPLITLRGSGLTFVSGEQPLLVISGEKTWLFADTEDAFFP